MDVAFRIGRGAHDDADEADAAAHGAGDEVVAGGDGVAGFQAIGAFVIGQHAIVVRDFAAVEVEARHAEIVIFDRKILDQVMRQQSQVPRSGHLLRVGQAGRIAEGAVRHAERAGAQRHHLGKAVFVAADQFAQGAGGIVGGFSDDSEDTVFDGETGAGQRGRALMVPSLAACIDTGTIWFSVMR